MALPKHTPPGALTRKEFGYTPPSYEQLIEELECISGEMGGTIKKLTVYDSKGRQSKKIVIEYDVREKDDT